MKYRLTVYSDSYIDVKRYEDGFVLIPSGFEKGPLIIYSVSFNKPQKNVKCYSFKWLWWILEFTRYER